MPPRWKNFSLLESLSRCSQIAVALTLTASTVLLANKPTQAEGSRSLYPANATGFRAFLDWRGPTAGSWLNLLQFRTLLKVYAQAGEYIFLGSSAVGVVNANTNTVGDIRVYNPGLVTGLVGSENLPGNPSFSCDTQRTNTGTANQGQILTRAQELAGPNPAPGGYVPCFYQAPVTGVYDVVFYGPNGVTGIPNPIVNLTGLINPLQIDANQGTSVAAFDVTVRTNLTSTTDLNGRLFTYYPALFTGANGRPVNSTLYTLTTDGFLYQTNLNGIDPNGFVLFGNRVGFLDPDRKTPLNRDAFDGSNDLITQPQGGLVPAYPEFPVFFNRPDPQTQGAITPPPPIELGGGLIPGASARTSIPQVPIRPVLSNFSFTGTAGGNNSTFGTGGTFSYTANVENTYELVISRNGQNFDPTNPNNKVLRGIGPSGTVTVPWDGTDNSGNPFPVRRDYPAQMQIETGNYHFPLLDVENSARGPTFTLLNPPGGACPYFADCGGAFYDDRGYRTSTGAIVGTVGQPLPGINPPTLPYSGAPGTFGAFDSSSMQRSFGNGLPNGFGDKKGLDIWTYFPGNLLTTPLNIVAASPDLSIQKTHRGNFLVGQQGVYQLRVRNAPKAGPTTGSITVTDTLPNGLSFISATGTNWACSAVGQLVTCAYNGTALAPGAFAPPITLTVNVSSAAAPGVTNTATVTTPGDSNPNNNTVSDTTPVIVSPVIHKSVHWLRDNDGSGTLTVGDDLQYTIIVQNPSNNSVPITNLVISDIVTSQLQVLRDSANPITVNSGFSLASTLPSSSFNGTDNSVNFTAPGTLAPGASVTLTFNAHILPSASNPVVNQASADFQGDNGKPILSDASDTTNPTQPGSGVNPGNPSVIESGGNVNQPNNSNTDPTIINITGAVGTGQPHLRLVKRITNVTRGGVPISGVDFSSYVNDPADPNDDAQLWSQFLPVGVSTLGSQIQLQSGDEVEYTIYFLSDGTSQATGVQVCDAIPTGTTFIPDSFGSGSGILLNQSGTNTPQTNAGDADKGTFFSPLNPVTAPCTDTNNPNGSVFVQLGTVPNTSPNNVGFVRFQVKIN